MVYDLSIRAHQVYVDVRRDQSRERFRSACKAKVMIINKPYGVHFSLHSSGLKGEKKYQVYGKSFLIFLASQAHLLYNIVFIIIIHLPGVLLYPLLNSCHI